MVWFFMDQCHMITIMKYKRREKYKQKINEYFVKHRNETIDVFFCNFLMDYENL